MKGSAGQLTNGGGQQQLLLNLVSPREAAVVAAQLPGWEDAVELGREVQGEAPQERVDVDLGGWVEDSQRSAGD